MSERISCTACLIENAEILMISRNGSSAVKADQAEAPVSQAVEALHMAGSAVVTGGVAAVLIVVAIPVSLGLGIAWAARSIGTKFSRTIRSEEHTSELQSLMPISSAVFCL